MYQKSKDNNATDSGYVHIHVSQFLLKYTSNLFDLLTVAAEIAVNPFATRSGMRSAVVPNERFEEHIVHFVHHVCCTAHLVTRIRLIGGR